VQPADRLTLTDPAWLAFVAQRPDALPFHLPAWIATVAESYRLPAFVLAVRDAGGAVAAGLPVVETRLPLRPRRWVSLPFTDYCPPLAVSATAETHLAEALEAARLAAGASRAEVRGRMVGSRPFEHAGYRHVLPLEADASAVFARFHRSQVQRSIRRAEASGLVIRTGEPGRDLLDDFYRLHLGTRRRLGVPIQPRRFFARLRERVLRSGTGWIVTAELDGRAVAAALFLAANETVVYKFGASESDSWNLRPNHLIFWHVIRDACARGYRRLDFGRTDADTEGLRAFKRSWGAEEEELVYHAFGATAGADTGADAVRPHGAGKAQRTLSAVIRRSPAWVCRWTGELLYRFVA
jgi:CelD/BcsL family acetyltransferase involved in cellulose biosynthesis